MVFRFKRRNCHTGGGQPSGPSAEGFHNGNLLRGGGVLERHVAIRQRQSLAFFDDALRQGMADPVDIGVLDILADPVRTWMDLFAGERVAFQREGMIRRTEIGVRLQIVPADVPQPVLVLGQIVFTCLQVDAQLFMHLLVKIFQEALARLVYGLVDLRLQLRLQSVEGGLNLHFGPALLVNPGDPLLEIHARFDTAQDLVAGPEDTVKKLEFLGEQLVDALIGGVALVEEIDHDHVVVLSVAMAPADALLNPLRVPGQVVVDHEEQNAD